MTKLKAIITLLLTLTHSGPAIAALGNESACRDYQGLPKGWRSDAHAGMVQVRADSSFWIDRTEVTVAQFATFVAATGYVTEAERDGGGAVFAPPKSLEFNQRPQPWWRYVEGATWRHPRGPRSKTPPGNHPVIMITQADALAYAHWLGRDLPTEAEWELAAAKEAGESWPPQQPRNGEGRPIANYWQGAFPTENTVEDGHAALAPVGCYTPNRYGLYDTIGNAWEWTRDAWSGPQRLHINGDPSAAKAEHSTAAQRSVIKGGSWLCSPNYCVRYNAAAREAQESNLGTTHIGFRTVLR